MIRVLGLGGGARVRVQARLARLRMPVPRQGRWLRCGTGRGESAVEFGIGLYTMLRLQKHPLVV